MTGAFTFVPATPEQVETVRKNLGTNELDIRRTVASLRDWLSKQPHLPKQIDDAHIERMYIQCKCSTERVKKGLDFYFSLRTRYPEILQNRDPVGTEIVTMREHLTYVVMPRLTKELYRLHICMDVDPDPRWVLFQTYGKITSMGVELLYFDDYSLGDVFIIDMANVTVGHVLRANINVIRAMEFIHKNAYCRRLKGLHFINCDSVTDFVMKVLKVALTEKLQKRVHVHLPGSTTLFDHLERQYLPDELGGTAGPVDKLTGEFMKAMGRKRAWFLEQDKYTSDESKRPADNHYVDDMYGAQGSFKKLTVD